MPDLIISDIRYYPYRLPMRGSFTTAHEAMATREGAIVEILTRGGPSGLGEIAPLPAFGGGTLAAARASLSLLANHLRGKMPGPALALLYTLIALSSGKGPTAIPAATACGLESALLDLVGQLEGKSVGELLLAQKHTAPLSIDPPVRTAQNGVRELVPVNAVIGATDIQDAQKAAQEALLAGFKCVKLKMGRQGIQEQIDRVAAVREALGPTAHLRLDANEGWDFEQASAILSRCEPFSIQYVEQPLPAAALADMRRLRGATSIPLAADEAVSNLESVHQVLAAGAADILIVKPQLAGGLRAGRRIIQEALQQGLQCVVTSMLEAGVGVAGALHLAAASSEVTLECGLATLPLLEDDLLLDALPIQDGWMAVPAGPGLGVSLDRVALEKYKS